MPVGELVTETFGYDGGRLVTAYVPPAVPELVVYGGDGALITGWGATLEAAGAPATLIVGVHRSVDETARLQEYSPSFDPDRFAAHERFVVEDVRRWVVARFGLALPVQRTAVLGVSAGAELALALGLHHPGVFGAVLAASPGAGYRPPTPLPGVLPRVYLVAGTDEPFFRANAGQWAAALSGVGADVVMVERPGGHGDPFWEQEFPRMVEWVVGE